eukprot:TRINITY_DN2217_c0_g1_i2.p6 TRINITY_DN2217_c0_g1~~TRINITY_DN2217_c0_g1_i2.p6  ORF type:complete len:108 (-),score=25.44 TRINITY_DN2217_c0_g1_i2:756-1079(-)
MRVHLAFRRAVCESRSEYVFEAGDGVYIDARDAALSSWHRYMNHSRRGFNVHVGAIVEPPPFSERPMPQVQLRTIADISPGQELLLNYGDSYWDPDDAVMDDFGTAG